MISVQKNFQLKQFNTLSLDVLASHYVNVTNIDMLEQALDYAKQNNLNVLVLSGGSNMLLPESIDALVIHINIKEITLLHDTDHDVTVKVGAGQNWHDFVCLSTEKKWYGLQNLALIPGLVGAAPVQNIGAYGVEVGEFIDQVYVYDRTSNTHKTISAQDCDFTYRHSIFKDNPSRYIITHVSFKLLKQAQLKMTYGDLKSALADDLSAENLQRQVIHIRQSKLPDPKDFANVGSFFKNPIITLQQCEALLSEYPNLPHYMQANNQVKIAAGWLIDQAGWKGKKLNMVGMFDKQALVLVNYGGAVLEDVVRTYQAVQHDVYQKFNIQLEPEPVRFNAQGLISQ